MKKMTPSLMITMFALSFALAQPAFAGMEKDHKDHIDTMRKAAEELKATNPELSGKLSAWADKKEKWKDEHGKEDKKEMMEQKKKDLETLRQAGMHLQHDTADEEGKDLGNKVDDIVKRWEEKMKEKKEKMKDKH